MVVFDMAGTTINEDNLVYKTLQQTLSSAGYNCTLELVLANGAGKEKKKAITDILQQLDAVVTPAQIDGLFAAFLVNLERAYAHAPVTPQDNAEDVFLALRNRDIRVVLNTGYDETTAMSLLRKLNWWAGEQIDAVITATDVTAGRPHPDMICLAMQRFGLTEAKRVAKVGDSVIDIEEGRSAGCGLVAGITTGAHSFEQLQTAAPDYIINNLIELLPLL